MKLENRKLTIEASDINGRYKYKGKDSISGNETEFNFVLDKFPCILEYVDLGLPSGNQWATCNLGAFAPEETGAWFGMGEPYSKNDFPSKGLTRIGNYKTREITYNHIPSYCDTWKSDENLNDKFASQTTLAEFFGKMGIEIPEPGNYTSIPAEFDAANVWTNGVACLPNMNDIVELWDETDQEYIDVNGKPCIKFTGEGVYDEEIEDYIYPSIIIPLAGAMNGNIRYDYLQAKDGVVGEDDKVAYLAVKDAPIRGDKDYDNQGDFSDQLRQRMGMLVCDSDGDCRCETESLSSHHNDWFVYGTAGLQIRPVKKIEE